MSANLAVIYYSATGQVHRLAEAVAQGASEQGAEVRLRRVAELAPPEAIEANPVWQAHHDFAQAEVHEAHIEDLRWADGYLFGTPTRFGNPSAQLKQFIDQAGPLWAAGELSGKAAGSFVSQQNLHGGAESTILALNNVFYHWGSVVIPPGYADPRVFAAGGNPYGSCWASGNGEYPDEKALEAARWQGWRTARFAEALRVD